MRAREGSTLGANYRLTRTANATRTDLHGNFKVLLSRNRKVTRGAVELRQVSRRDTETRVNTGTALTTINQHVNQRHTINNRLTAGNQNYTERGRRTFNNFNSGNLIQISSKTRNQTTVGRSITLQREGTMFHRRLTRQHACQCRHRGKLVRLTASNSPFLHREEAIARHVASVV